MKGLINIIIRNGPYFVYVHTNKINGKKYVGITRQRIEDRWKRGSAYKGNPHFYNAINKYGWDGFDHKIFASNLTEDEAKNMEETLIRLQKLQNENFGYNITGGGDVPITHNEYVRKKISEKLKGEKHPCYGKHLSEETRRRISESEKGKKAPYVTEQRSIPVMCIETNEVYPSARVASEKLGIQRTAIVRAMKLEYMRAGGYHWKKYQQSV